jgi:protein arginine kinase activator
MGPVIIQKERRVKCQSCELPATVHLTEIVGGKKKELHLCQDCAKKKDILKQQEINLSVILQTVIGQHVGASADELSRLNCPACGIKYMEFKAEGRLGCPHDYVVFRGALLPLLERIHRGVQHKGKVPRNAPRHSAAQAEVRELRQRLRQAIETEAYEDAARLRDAIKQREAADEPG